MQALWLILKCVSYINIICLCSQGVSSAQETPWGICCCFCSLSPLMFWYGLGRLAKKHSTLSTFNAVFSVLSCTNWCSGINDPVSTSDEVDASAAPYCDRQAEVLMKADTEIPGLEAVQMAFVRFAVKEDPDIGAQQSESLAVVKQGKCHRSAAVSLCIASWDLPWPHTHPSWDQKTSEALCDPPLALCLASDVRDHNRGQDSQTLSCAVRKLFGIWVCVPQMEGGQVLLFLNSQKHSRSDRMIWVTSKGVSALPWIVQVRLVPQLHEKFGMNLNAVKIMHTPPSIVHWHAFSPLCFSLEFRILQALEYKRGQGKTRSCCHWLLPISFSGFHMCAGSCLACGTLSTPWHFFTHGLKF